MINPANNQWAQLELRHFIALQAIAETGSFGRAALQVGYTQSAISQQIVHLEAIVGERLIERSRGLRPIHLTEPGRILVRHAEAIVAHLRAAQADMTAYHIGALGTLRVGTYQSVSTQLLPLVLRSFSVNWPHVEVQLTEEMNLERLLSLVASGDLDLAFTTMPLLDGPFAAVELLRDSWMVLQKRDAPLKSLKNINHKAFAEVTENDKSNLVGSVEAGDLNECPMISYRVCGSTLHLESYLKEHVISLHTVFRTDDNGTMRGLVAAGIGAALMPRLAIEPDPRVDVFSLHLDGEPVPPRIIALAWHRDRYLSQAAQTFIETAQQCSCTLAQEVYELSADLPEVALSPQTQRAGMPH
jgi:DNA-binding transcriptional LysR family regulator